MVIKSVNLIQKRVIKHSQKFHCKWGIEIFSPAARHLFNTSFVLYMFQMYNFLIYYLCLNGQESTYNLYWEM